MDVGSIFFALNAETGKAPERLMLLPAGPVVKGRDGRTWLLSDPDAVLAATAERGVDLAVDINHSTDLQAPLGADAPAVGWIANPVKNEKGEIWGDVAWTDEGQKLILSRAYRYISPVFDFDPDTREITALIGAGLANRPNLRLPALNSESTPDGEPQRPAAGMKEDTSMKKINAALGLAESASEDDAVTAIAALKETRATNAQAPGVDLTAYAPRADLAQMETRATNAERALADLKAADLKTRAVGAVDAAVKERKIAPASRGAYLAMCASEEGLASFGEIMKSSPAIVPAQDVDAKGNPPKTEQALNAEEAEIASKMGYTPEAWKKIKEVSN